MPNHCGNRLTVSSINPKSAEDLVRFGEMSMRMKRAGNQRNEAFDICQYMQMPKELEDIHSGGITINGKSYREWREIKKGKKVIFVGVEPAEKEALIIKYGACNPIDWCVKILGTKWGTYESHVTAGDGRLVYTYKTAWSPLSDACLQELSAKWPTLSFLMEYAERGEGYYGFCYAENGKIIDTDTGVITEAMYDKNGDFNAGPTMETYKELVDMSG